MYDRAMVIGGGVCKCGGGACLCVHWHIYVQWGGLEQKPCIYHANFLCDSSFSRISIDIFFILKTFIRPIPVLNLR